MEAVCLKKKRQGKNFAGKAKTKENLTTVNRIKVPEITVQLEGQHIFDFEVDTGAGDNFLDENA